VKLTCLLLPLVLAAGIACTKGLELAAEVEGLNPISNIESVVHLRSRGAAAAALFAAGASSLYGTPIVNARSRWGN
jgi:hypothetical protein